MNSCSSSLQQRAVFIVKVNNGTVTFDPGIANPDERSLSRPPICSREDFRRTRTDLRIAWMPSSAFNKISAVFEIVADKRTSEVFVSSGFVHRIYCMCD